MNGRFFRKWISALILLGVLGVISIPFADNLFAAEISLEQLGYQFYSKTLEIEWKLATNQLPATVRTFKVVPMTFSPAIISNLVSWGGFTESNRVWSSDGGKRFPYDTLIFRKADNRQWLTIDPASGQAHLYNPILKWAMPEGVPDKPRAYFLATNMLQRLGFSTNELILEDA